MRLSPYLLILISLSEVPRENKLYTLHLLLFLKYCLYKNTQILSTQVDEFLCAYTPFYLPPRSR